MATVVVDKSAFGGVPGDSFVGTDLKIVVGHLEGLPSSYATGGFAVDLSDEFEKVLLVLFEVDGFLFEYDYAEDVSDGKVLAFSAAATEVSAATDVSSAKPRFIAYGYDKYRRG